MQWAEQSALMSGFDASSEEEPSSTPEEQPSHADNDEDRQRAQQRALMTVFNAGGEKPSTEEQLSHAYAERYAEQCAVHTGLPKTRLDDLLAMYGVYT